MTTERSPYLSDANLRMLRNTIGCQDGTTDALLIDEVFRLRAALTASGERIATLERWYMQAGDRVHELERRYEPSRDPWQPADNAATEPGGRT